MKRTRRALMLLTALVALPGCRSSEKGERRDPLMGRYIPKTDLPVPGRDVAGRKDPLLTQPAKGEKDTRRSQVEKDTYRNTQATSVAGLAGRPEGVVMPRKGTPLRRDPSTDDDDVERRRGAFEAMGATLERPMKDGNGDAVIGAVVPAGADGAQRRFEGKGRTLNEALDDLLKNLQADQAR
jgi:hypothetical protein